MTVYLKVHFPNNTSLHSFVLEKNERKRNKPIELMAKKEEGEIDKRKSLKQLIKDANTLRKIIQSLKIPDPGLIAQFILVVYRKAEDYPVEVDIEKIERNAENLEILV